VRPEDANATQQTLVPLDPLDPLALQALLVNQVHVAKAANLVKPAAPANLINRNPSTVAVVPLAVPELQELPVPPDLQAQTDSLDEPAPQENQRQLDRLDPKELLEIKDEQDPRVLLDQTAKMDQLAPRVRQVRRDPEGLQEPQGLLDNPVNQAPQAHKDLPDPRDPPDSPEALEALVPKAHLAPQVRLETTPNTALAPHGAERQHKPESFAGRFSILCSWLLLSSFYILAPVILPEMP